MEDALNILPIPDPESKGSIVRHAPEEIMNEALAGAFAGACGTVVGFPLDTIKVTDCPICAHLCLSSRSGTFLTSC